MSLGAAVARARELAVLAMLDAVTVTRQTRAALDEVTGRYPVAAREVYAGPGRIRAAASRTADAAGVAVVVGRPVLELPWDGDGAADLLAGDRVRVDSGPLSGVSAVVVSVERSTSQTCRAYVVEVAQ